jgi:hypothetical protein
MCRGAIGLCPRCNGISRAPLPGRGASVRRAARNVASLVGETDNAAAVPIDADNDGPGDPS